MQRPLTRADAGAAALVERPRLLGQLETAVRLPLTVLAAPAGYGKTTLVQQWAASHEGPPVAWVPLGDDGGTEVGRLQLAAVERLVAEADDVVLVFDGLDSHRDDSITRDLERLVERVPDNVHVIVTRRSPWFTDSHHRPAATFGPDDLAFSRDEMRSLVATAAGRPPTEVQLDELARRTAGWALGVRVCTAAILAGADTDSAIEALRAGDPRIAAFLGIEVLDRQAPALRDFLRQTSVLAELTPGLCASVSRDPRAGAMLRTLAAHGVIAPRTIDGAPRYAHHPLLHDLLRGEVRRAGVEEVELLHRAAAFHSARGEPKQAAAYLVEAEAWDDLIALVDEHARSFFERGRAQEILDILDVVPHHRHREIALRRAYLLTMVGHTRRAAQALRSVEVAPGDAGAIAVTEALRAGWAYTDGDPAAALVAADAALDALAQQPAELPDVFGLSTASSLEAMAVGGRGRALWYQGDAEQARSELQKLVHRSDAYSPWRLHALGTMALLDAWRGNFRLAVAEAQRACAGAVRLGGASHPCTIDAHLAIAHVLRERNQLRSAALRQDRAYRIAREFRRPFAVAQYGLERALLHLAAGEPELGLQELHERRLRGAPLPRFLEARLCAAEIKLLVGRGDVDRASALVARDGGAPEAASAAVEVALAQKDLDRARGVLDAWEVQAGDERARLERQVWTAAVELADGHRPAAVQLGLAAARDAKEEGHVRLFLDGGRPLARLVHALRVAVPNGYLIGLERFSLAHQTSVEAAPLGLSQRELEILRYLPTPLSSSEIAAQLYISLNTLKTHLRTIYRKLDATNRREAINRAQQLGLA